MTIKCIVRLNKDKFDDLLEALKPLNDLKQLEKCISELSSAEKSSSSTVTFPADVIFKLKKSLAANKSSLCIHNFIHPSSFIVIDDTKPPQRSPELVARLDKLRREEEQRLYNQLVANVAPPPQDKAAIGSIATELRSLDRQIISVVNFVLTVAGAFVFGYKAPELLWGFEEVMPRFMFGLLCGAAVFIADIYFLIVRGA